MTNRPVYLNLLKIRLPITGIVSILHRVSGLLLFLAVPYLVYLLDMSVSSEVSYLYVKDLIQQPVTKAILLFILWSLVHHFFAGIRYLLIDAEIGVNKTAAMKGAWIVIAAEVIAFVVLAGVLI